MKVFVGYGYNERDKWIKELIIPFISALGCEVVTGEDLHGENLSQGVKARISESNVAIGFLTQRDQIANGKFTTHRWVTDELAHAEDKIPIFEVWEKDVDAQKGITGDRQRYVYEDKALLLYEITKFIMNKKAQINSKTFLLMPPELIADIKPELNSEYTTCTYSFLYKAKEYEHEKTKILRMGDGLGIIVKQIPSEEALIEIRINSPNKLWVSGYVPVGSINVKLNKEK